MVGRSLTVAVWVAVARMRSHRCDGVWHAQLPVRALSARVVELNVAAPKPAAFPRTFRPRGELEAPGTECVDVVGASACAPRTGPATCPLDATMPRGRAASITAPQRVGPHGRPALAGPAMLLPRLRALFVVKHSVQAFDRVKNGLGRQFALLGTCWYAPNTSTGDRRLLSAIMAPLAERATEASRPRWQTAACAVARWLATASEPGRTSRPTAEPGR